MDYSPYENADYILQYNDRKMKFKYHQLTVKWIGKLFGLYPESILLFTDQEGQLEVPDDSGKFHLEEIKVYKVQGESIPTLGGIGDAGPSMLTFSSPVPPTGTVTPNALPYPYPPVNQPNAHKKSKRFSLKTKAPEPPSLEASVGWRKNIELYEYSKISRELRKTSNYPLSLTTSSASLSYITEKISAECYSNNEVVLLDNDNFKIPSNSCTQGKKSCFKCIIILVL